ncbi:MAG: flavodoxin-dependent (E)-4-hydroxy-3-methylbut-2-enyl-diphosphate synthase [Oscillospiraceae bacterium]|jgi:(E)-4-hydroxy-3-methylbut-2-enyl-diphosphate synthase|nr:flavodoxin-dependent (E)-4-hydroxy-3-methylbut-2-enyl-diphosphate synthase [Oscillospiraceae bacterium]
MKMRMSRQVMVGGVAVGGGAAVTVQSMLNRPAHDVAANLEQAASLESAGCQILRAAVPDHEAVRLIAALKVHCGLPIVADIHFDYKLALESVAAGADKIRINPGNIGGQERVRQVAAACRARGVPIRVGVNSGSLEPELLQKHGAPTPEAMAESAMGHIRLLEACDFTDIVVSLKSSSVQATVAAYELLAARCDYPLHLGITEAGTARMGLVKSAVGIGALLLRGLGDTIRVSLTAEPVEEIAAGRDILRALGLGGSRPNLIACPTCGRTKIDMIALAQAVEQRLEGCTKPVTVAVMGCAVNGPGEAREADVGLAGGDGCALLFRKGEILRKVPEAEALDALMAELEKL